MTNSATEDKQDKTLVDTSPAIDAAQTGIDGPGNYLKSQREANNLSEMEAASRLNISIHQLRYLEADDYDNLPAPIFVQNYLTRYADLFGLPVKPLLDAYQSYAAKLQPELSRVSQKEKLNSRHASVRWATYTVIALILGLALFWFLNVGFSKLWTQVANGSDGGNGSQTNTLSLPGQPSGAE